MYSMTEPGQRELPPNGSSFIFFEDKILVAHLALRQPGNQIATYQIKITK